MKKLVLFVPVVLFGLGSFGCDTTCTIIKTAADVCNMVEYVGPDGKIYQIKVTKEEVESMAADAAARDGVPGPAGVATPAPEASPAVPPPAAPPTAPTAPPAPVPAADPTPAGT